MVASKRRLREAKEKTFRGNSGTDYRARYVPLDPVALLAELEEMYPDS